MNTLPVVALVAFVGIGFGARIAVQLRRYGRAGLHLKGHPPFSALAVAVVALALAGQGALAWVAPERLEVLAIPLPAAVRLAGFGLCLLGIAAMFVAQLDLGASWRIGIDPQAREGLVTSGLYAFSRNPIYLFVLVAMAGWALLVPTVLSLAALVIGQLLIRWQIASEERWLAATYPAEFTRYSARVGRLWPRALKAIS